ncbi:uncharacterized protein [Argopecten irradians]|uniref:uncharacterized protein n=1 Tax=Argopecten irradians TaxID=31199 RepID=UPI003721F824
MARKKVLAGLCMCSVVMVISWKVIDNNSLRQRKHGEINDENVNQRHDQRLMLLPHQGNLRLVDTSRHFWQDTNKDRQKSRTQWQNRRENLKSVTVYTKQPENSSWALDKVTCDDAPLFKSVKLKTEYGSVDIFIHDPRKDTWVSAVLSRGETWEQDLVDLITKILKEEKHAALLDIGANIGVYTLVAAMLGFNVIAVEPLEINVQRLCSSMGAGNFTGNVTIVRNALSDHSQRVTIGKVIANVGGSYILQEKNANKAKSDVITGKYPDIIWTTTLDDILKLPGYNLEKVVIKMDVEGYENKVLNGGMNFFDLTNIPVVLMEWNYHKSGSSGQEILKFFSKRNYSAYLPMENMKLDPSHSNEWPADILWKKD